MVAERRILFFTLHKCASMFIHRVCTDLARISGRAYFSPNGGDFQVSLQEMVTSVGFWQAHKAGCFGPLRLFIEIPEMEHDRILLHLRDPRDVLVSMYYSYCFSHGGEISGGTGYRKEVAERGIDEFVLKLATAEERPVAGDYGTGSHVWEIAGNMRQRYFNYMRHLLDGQLRNVALVRYEDMIGDLEGWLEKVAAQFDVSEPATIRQLAGQYRPAFDRTGENEWTHVRKVTPGDHLEKLRPETIAQLDRIFGEVLDTLGYRRAAAG